MTKVRVYTQDYRRFSRLWWLEQGRTLFWVAIITVLIWVYADIEKSDTRDYRATIRLTTGEASNLLLLSDSEVDVNFTVKGSGSNLDDFERWFKNQRELEYDVSSYGPSEKAVPVSMDEIILRAAELDKRGLTVDSASPGVIDLKLDRRIRIDGVPVQFDYTGATLDADPVVSPEKVNIFVAESLWKAVRAATDKPVLKTRQVDLRNVATDKPLTVEIIPSVAGVAVEPETKTVQVAVRISQRIETKPVRLPVRVITPASWVEEGTWTEYALVRKDPLEWQPQVTVKGIKKNLDQLRPEDVQAYVILSDDDKKPVASWLNREVVIRLPEQLELELIGEKPTVNFKLEKRSPTPP